jgi:hypothetical protein
MPYAAGRVAEPSEEASAGPVAAPGKEASAAALGEAVTAEPDGNGWRISESLTAFDPDKTWKKAEQVGRFRAGILSIRA